MKPSGAAWGARQASIALLAMIAAHGCEEKRQFAHVFRISEMAQVIGGPAAAARPGDFLLENDRIRAVIHGRHNMRSTMPLSNGSLIDLDIQRPHHRYGVGKGEDAFYELGGMVNLKVNSSREMASGPAEELGAAEAPAAGCVRVTASGPGENFMGVLGLLDLAMTRPYPANALELVTDYDVCPGEPVVRVSTTARFYGKGEPIELDPLTGPTSLLATLLGESLDIDCAKQPCPAGAECDDMLRNLSLGTLSTEMKRCREPAQRVAGVMAGDLVLMSGKVRTFTPGSGFDHDSYVRSVFDSGGDIFSNPLALDFIAAVSDDVSYVYFEQRGKLMIPVFSESFTVSMTNGFGCPRSDPKCMEGKELRYHRFVSVGHGDVASALAGYYKIRGIATGRVEGHVTDVRTGDPASGMNVFVLRLPQAWEGFSDAEIAARSYQELIAANQAATRSDTRPLGEVGIISHFRTDSGIDPIKDGGFRGLLPPGRYVLVARDAKRLASPLVPIRVVEGEVARASLFAGEHGRMEFDILDASGRHMPGKLTIGRCFAECARDEDCRDEKAPYCFVGSGAPCGEGQPPCGDNQTCTIRGCVAVGPLAGLCTPTRDGRYRSEEECRDDQVWDAAQSTCVCRSLALPLELKGRRNADGTEATLVSPSGRGVAELPPGTYQVIASRGIEYEVKRAFVTLRPGTVKRFAATLPRVVDTSGWIAADFHVHGPNSVDSGLDHRTRVASYAAEGVELLSASDHDQLTDYAPTIHDLKLGPWIKSQIGLEVSPLDYGHFLGFPLFFNENAELKGAFHWRAHKADDADPDWQNLPPQQIFNEIRERGAFGPDTVVAIAHFYDHFTFFGVDPFTLELPAFSITAMSNLVLLPSNFSGEFDALEGLNGKGIDLIRRPTYNEVRDYNVRVAEILGDLSQPYIERQRAWAKVSAEAQRSFFVRTEEEQQRNLSFANPDFACRCSSDAECGPGSLCDERTGDCIRSCCRVSGDGVKCTDELCDAALVAAGRERCQPHPGASDNEQRQRYTCQRVEQPCSRNAECLRVSWDGRTEDCVAVDAAEPDVRTCELACASDRDCGDPLRPQCIDKRCLPHPVSAAAADDPCPTLRGTLDDWFLLLNHGVRRTMMGNSDSHDTYGGEAGLPRNYVRSSADVPPAIDRLEIARNVKAGQSFATYGPFVEVTLNGQPLGSTVSVQPGARVKLHVKVQSPRWFDVDRIEIYRNAELIRVITGRTDCARGEINCIRVPNDEVVNFDQDVEDQPTEDVWYAVVAMGAEGRGMAPVYSSTPVARLGIFELIQRLTPLLPPLRSLRTPFAPSITEVRPYSVTNPIFVDVGGDGYAAPLPPPGWAPEAAGPAAAAEDKSDALQLGLGQAAPARGQAQAAGHSHDHRRGIGRMRAEAADLSQLLQQGKVTQRDLQRAFDALRYLR